VSDNIANTLSPLLRSKGWDACVDARLLRASESWEEAPEFRGYGHSLRRFFTDLKIDAVLCLEGRPSVCIKDARTSSSGEVELLRRQLWNSGATTLFVAEGKNDIKVFSTLTKPARDDVDGHNAQLREETIQNLHEVELSLRLRRLLHRIETGVIYRDYKSLFDSSSAVDQVLLDNLSAIRNLICPEKSRRGYEQAHAIIGRFLFSCYLLDRHIIGRTYLEKAKLPEADDMLGLLEKSTDGSKTLNALFKVLQRDFNGSLFGNLVDDYNIGDKEVSYLRRFLIWGESSHRTVVTIQALRFWLYSGGTN